MGSLDERVRVGVAAVVMDDEGRFLFSKRIADKHGAQTWSFPGGKPDAGESPLEACLRELEEETGIKADWGQPLGLWTYDRFESHDLHYVTLYFLVDHGEQVPQNLEPEKHSDWEWLDADEARERDLFPGVEQIVGLFS
jgi:8-oxo-dGTP diphosphatase